MIHESFIFLDGIGPERERALWADGVTHWNHYLARERVKGISTQLKQAHDVQLLEMKRALLDDDMSTLARTIPAKHQWRLYDLFRDSCAFLDIETSGYYGDVTVVGLYDGRETKMYVRGHNLDRSALLQELNKYPLFVTFNGGSFDLPVLKRFFQWRPEVAHIDLRGVCSQIGLHGGLKSIEQQVGISRAEEVKGISGAEAGYLWHQYRTTGKKDFLELLLKYNEEDIVNLRPLADKMIKELWMRTRKATHF